MTDRDSKPRAIGTDKGAAHFFSIALTGVVMWILHAGDHGTAIVLVLGIGFYVLMLTATLAVARQRANRREATQKANFAADTDERNRGLYGRG